MLASCSLAAAAAARQCCWARATHSIAPSSAAGLLEVGKEFEARRQFSAADVAAFAALTGDANPIHTQPVRPRAASDTVLSRSHRARGTAQAAAHAAGLDACPTPGLLVAALFPAIIGSQLVRPWQQQ
jgi:acyl dehydratase